MTVLQAGSATDAGLVRRVNQDQLLVRDHVFAVADGMGGHAGGEVASLTAIDALNAVFARTDSLDGGPEDLRAAVRRANEAVFERSQSGDDLRGMGTTMTAAALVVADGEERLAIANVGDSRAYVFAQGELTQLTEDHSVPEELVRQGQLAPEEVASHPQRHMLTRVLGILPEVDVDLWEVVPLTGDRILLCSDGLCRELTDEQIAAVLRRLPDPTQAARELVSRARASGGSDNITVVIIDVIDDDGRSGKASAALAAMSVPSSSTTTQPTAAEPDIPRPRRASAAVDREPGLDVVTSELPRPPVHKRRRRVTVRVLGFFLVLAGILAGAGYAIYFYARGSFYVGLAPSQSALGSSTSLEIVIYRGRPGGLLWFSPTVEQRTPLTTADVLPFRIGDLRSGKIEPSLSAARAYLANLTQEATAVAHTSPTSSLPPLPSAGSTTSR